MKERHLLVFTHEMNVADGTLGLENHDGSGNISIRKVGPEISDWKISTRKYELKISNQKP
jgi:hypothetical protein